MPFWFAMIATSFFSGSVELAAGTDESIRRAIPYLEEQGVDWMERRGCVSCHQIPFMLWSLSSAESQGFDVDPAKLKRWREWSVDVTNFVKSAEKSDVDVPKTLAVNIDTMNALLMAIEDDGAPWRSQFADALIKNQNKDGTWKACGQLPAQKRSSAETTQVTVTWTLITLAKQGRQPTDSEQARTHLEPSPSPESTEWLIATMLLADQSDDSAAVGRWLAELRKRQHDDGGWGWLSKEPSDALATGMALYAISKLGTDAECDQACSAAVAFLVDTQKENGAWAVPGTKKTTRKKATPTSSYWGTAWAVIGLLESRLSP